MNYASGWRPFMGWICGGALAYQYLLRPLGNAAFILYAGDVSSTPLPGLDDNLWQLLTGILGLGGLRTVEKINGVAAK